jgi:putative nucleotidyltransferase with HDIG domain
MAEAATTGSVAHWLPMKTAPPRITDDRWQPRPVLAAALRLVSVLVPAAVGAASAYAFAAAVPLPGGVARAGWVVVLVTISTIATALAERVGRRSLPLAVLFRLSLVFPDRAPSRFVVVRGAGNVRLLERRIRDAREHGLDPEPARAAEQILGLVAALSAHDRKTRGHSERVRAFTDLLAAELRLPEEDRDRLRWAALLHDIGKLHVPSRVLNKPGRPEPREWERLQEHPAAGARIAAPLLAWLGPWGNAIEQHHERFGGGGYPTGASGRDIALAARIVSVADSFEVMTAARSYKKPISVPAARRELAACAGEQFDPAIVRAFLNVSLGRLWRTVGPASWTALLPLIGPAQRAGGQIASTAGAGAAALAVTAGTLLSALAGTAAASDAGDGPRVPTALGPADPEAAADPGPGATDEVENGDEGPTDVAGTSPEDEPPEPVDTDPVDDVLEDGGGAVGQVVDDTTGAVDEVVDGTGDAVDDVVGAGTDALDTVTGGSTEGLEGVVGGVTDTVDTAADGVTDLAGGLLGR